MTFRTSQRTLSLSLLLTIECCRTRHLVIVRNHSHRIFPTVLSVSGFNIIVFWDPRFSPLLSNRTRSALVWKVTQICVYQRRNEDQATSYCWYVLNSPNVCCYQQQTILLCTNLSNKEMCPGNIIEEMFDNSFGGSMKWQEQRCIDWRREGSDVITARKPEYPP